jgi:ABC-type multidrug transport system permease subunit
MTIKEFIAGIYFSISLFALLVEPTDGSSLKFLAWYYLISVANLAIAATILNRIIKKANANNFTRNGN